MTDYFCHSDRSRGIPRYFLLRIARDVSASLDMTKRPLRVGSVGSSVLLAITTIAFITEVHAQFTPGILANDSYWGDRKAEFDFYEGQLMREAQLRKCEVLHIFFRERIDPKTFARVDDPTRADAITSVRINQIWSAPIGMFVEQGSITAYWRVDSAALARLTFVGTDSFGNAIKKIESSGSVFNYVSDTYRDGSTTSPISPLANSFFYDELPMRVRTIDWSKPPVDFEIQLAPTLARFRSDHVEFKPARISWKPIEKTIEVNAQHSAGIDRFVLDRDFPFLIREWQMADGSKLKLKRGLKADYWNYGKEGDRERAFKNPMLQHPD